MATEEQLINQSTLHKAELRLIKSLTKEETTVFERLSAIEEYLSTLNGTELAPESARVASAIRRARLPSYRTKPD